MDKRMGGVIVVVLLVLIAIPLLPKIKSAFAPAPVMSDAQKLSSIREAIDGYRSDTGYYPVGLDDLVPEYLQTPIRTGSGKDFLYDRSTGEVQIPPTRQSTVPGRKRTPSITGGPMTEAMTGIGIQQELNY